jgi:phenylacetic acid degradation operon negative regulatory protein
MAVKPLDAVLGRLEKPPRTASLIVTVFGDAVLPRGGSLWLGSLQPILDCFGLKEGQVRTALSRLTEEGWLVRSRRGRLSFHRLGPRGEQDFAAARRIYFPPRLAWDGTLRLTLSEPPPEGFFSLAPGLALSPSSEVPPGLPALALTANDLASARALLARALPLARLAAGYDSFLRAFRQLPGLAPPLEALGLRILLVHEFRRLMLHEPALPAALLPEDWPGLQARALVRELYRRLLPLSEAWLDENGKGESGPLPPATPELLCRFHLNEDGNMAT